jgi:hypothetical protein
MTVHQAARAEHWPGALILASLVVHFRASTERPIELLWSCYASSVVLAVSILLGWQPGISAACVFHVGVGLPMYVLDLLAGGTTGSRKLTAAFAHLLAPVVAVWQVSRTGLSPGAWLAAAAFLAITQLLALFTDPKLNINVVHSPWEPVAGWFRSIWGYRAFNLVGASFLFYVADRGLRAILGVAHTGVA